MADGRDQKQAGRTSNKYAAKKAAGERIAAERAAHQRAERKRNLLIAGGSGLAVVVVIGAIVAIGLNSKKSTKLNPLTPASSTVTNALTTAATSTLAASPDFSTLSPPSAFTDRPITGAGGKPLIVYVGAEYCPNCGATRWPLALALSRFGSFSGLQTMYSDEDNIPTLSFRGSTYTSSYIDFDPKEMVDGADKPLEKLTAQESSLFEKFGGVPAGSTPGYPFIDFGSKWKQNGTVYDPTTLNGLTPESVAMSMTDTSSKAGASIQAAADVYSGIICQLDNGKPADVCSAPGVTAAIVALASLK